MLTRSLAQHRRERKQWAGPCKVVSSDSYLRIAHSSGYKAIRPSKEGGAGYSGVCLPVSVGFTKGEDDVFEPGHEVFGGVVHELQSTLVVWFRECMLLYHAVSWRDSFRLTTHR